MNKRWIFAVACVLMSAPVLAFDQSETDFWKALVAGGDAVAQGQASYAAAQAGAFKDQAGIDKVLREMGDGNEVAGAIAEYAQARKIPIRLDAKLPDYPRVLAPLIAAQVAPRILAGIPESSEKRYMELSMATRTWLELGGDKHALPVIEPLNGYKDQALADQFGVWLDNGSELALEKIGQATKTESFTAGTSGTKKEIEAANRIFAEFLFSESQWRRANAFRLQ